MNKFNHPVIVYVVISFVSLGCAVALFLLGGSLAEITGNNNSLLGFTFKAGGAIAGFILIYAFSHRTILKFNEKLQITAEDYKIELQKIMYDGTFLKYMSNEFRKKSWKNLTNTLYVSYFPDISEAIGNIVFEKFIPEELDYYHKDVEVYYRTLVSRKAGFLSGQSYIERVAKSDPFAFKLFPRPQNNVTVHVLVKASQDVSLLIPSLSSSC